MGLCVCACKCQEGSNPLPPCPHIAYTDRLSLPPTHLQDDQTTAKGRPAVSSAVAEPSFSASARLRVGCAAVLISTDNGQVR